MQPTDKPIHITLIDQPDAIAHQADSTLLESLEKAGLDVHFHCRQGFCGACRTKLHQGEVQYVADPLAYIDDGEILPCCCQPLTDVTLELG